MCRTQRKHELQTHLNLTLNPESQVREAKTVKQDFDFATEHLPVCQNTRSPCKYDLRKPFIVIFLFGLDMTDQSLQLAKPRAPRRKKNSAIRGISVQLRLMTEAHMLIWGDFDDIAS